MGENDPWRAPLSSLESNMLPRRESYDKIFLTTGAFPLLLIPAVEFLLQIPPNSPTGSIFSHKDNRQFKYLLWFQNFVVVISLIWSACFSSITGSIQHYLRLSIDFAISIDGNCHNFLWLMRILHKCFFFVVYRNERWLMYAYNEVFSGIMNNKR